MNSEAVQTRRERLLAAQAQCLSLMSDRGRRAFEERQCKRSEGPVSPANQTDEDISMEFFAEEIKKLVAETHRLRQRAESKRDIRAALRAVDVAMRVLGLYGRATGAISNGRRVTTSHVEAVPSREEGVKTAVELLFALATAEEMAEFVPRLEQRRLELQAMTVCATVNEEKSIPLSAAQENEEGKTEEIMDEANSEPESHK